MIKKLNSFKKFLITKRGNSNNLVPLGLVLIILALLYLRTMLPSQAFHDAGELQTVVPTINIAHPTGFPTFILIGKIFISIFPFGEIAWRVNLLSVIYSLITLFFLGLILLNLTGDKIFYLIGIFTLGLVRSFWDYSGMADTHTLNRLFIFLLIYLFYKLSIKWNKKIWFLFCIILGLGFGNHPLLIFILPGFFIWFILVYFQKKIPLCKKDCLVGFFMFLLGISVYLILPLKELFGPPFLSYRIGSPGDFYRHISGADFQGLMFRGGIDQNLSNMVYGIFNLKEQIGIWALIIGLIGTLFALIKYKIETVSLVIIFFSFLAFSTNYPTGDPSRYDLSYIAIYCLFVGIGAFAIYTLVTAIFKVSLNQTQILKYIILVFLFTLFLIIPYGLYKKNLLLVDKSKNYNARIYSEEIFQQVNYRSVILSWWNYSTPLWYRQIVLGERKDIIILNKNQWQWKELTDFYIKINPVYLVEYDQSVARHYNVIKEKNIYHVTLKQ